MSVEITGLNETLRRLAELEAQALRGAKRGLNQWSEETMTEAKERVPVEEGVLKASGFVEPPEEAGGVISQEIGFGGAASDYALVQHEDLSLNHPNGGQAKFLESAVNEREGQLARDIAAEVEQEIK